MDLDEMFKDSDKRKQFNSFCESTNSLQSTFSIDENIDIKQVVNSLNKTNRELAEENLILKDEINELKLKVIRLSETSDNIFKISNFENKLEKILKGYKFNIYNLYGTFCTGLVIGSLSFFVFSKK